MSIDPKAVKNITLGDVQSYELYFEPEEDAEGNPTGNLIEMCRLSVIVKFDDGETFGPRTYRFPIDDPTWRSDQIALVSTYALPRANTLLEDELT